MSESQHFKRNLFCDDVLTRGKILHLAMFRADDKNKPAAERYPLVVPLPYGFDCENDMPVIYMHLGKRPENPRMKAITDNPNVAFAVETDVEVVTMPSNPCMSTVRYRSVNGTGKIELIPYINDNKEMVEKALDIIMRQMTGKMADGKLFTWTYDKKIIQWLVVLKLTINSYVNPSHAYDCWSKPFSIPEGCKKKD